MYLRLLSPRSAVVTAVILLFASFSLLRAGTTRTQTLNLVKGWNAVFLEVDPTEADPESLLAGTPVDVVASYYAPTRTAQFVSDPSAELFKGAGWGVWYARERPDNFLTTLFAVYGNRAYLVHAADNHEWKVTGNVLPEPRQWRADSFNLVGFGIDPVVRPTFGQFFAGSPAHRHNRIYRLIDGTWKQVTNPDATSMRPGEAFWIYAKGGSKYQGPIRIETRSHHGILLGANVDAFTLRNAVDFPISTTIEHIVSGDAPVPLSMVINTVDLDLSIRRVAIDKPESGWSQALPPIEAGQAFTVPLEARLAEMHQPKQSSLLRITTDLGTVTWLPVHGIRSDLEDN